MMLSWHFITSTVYHNAPDEEKTSNKLFFLEDTKEIYRGTLPFTESIVLYTDEPTTKALGKLYVNASTLEGKVWDGSKWTTVIQPVISSVISGDTKKPVSSKAVEDFVADAISSDNIVSSVGYDANANAIIVHKTDGSSDTIPMTNVAVDLAYNKSTGLLQVKSANGTVIGTGVNLDLERFVSEATYDNDTKTIVLKFNDASDPIEIPVGALVDTYTASNSSTVQMTVTGNEFVAEVMVSKTSGNMLSIDDTGLYVAATDISGKVDKVKNATANNVAMLTAEGGIADSEVSVGGGTIAATPMTSVLATEAAVAAIRSTLQEAINAKMSKVDTGHAGEVIIAASDGDSALSGVTIGGAMFKENPDGSTLATEGGTVDYVNRAAVLKSKIVVSNNMATTVETASEEKVVSEEAVVSSLSWKTTI